MILERKKFAFKKGQIIHLDNFMEVAAYVQVEGRTKPYQSPHITVKWDKDLTDEHKVLKDFTVEVVVRSGIK